MQAAHSSGGTGCLCAIQQDLTKFLYTPSLAAERFGCYNKAMFNLFNKLNMAVFICMQ